MGYNGPMENTCKVCGATEKEAEFYRGMARKCKECHKDAVRNNRAENVAHYRQYDAERFQTDPKVLARHKRYQATEAGKASMVASRMKWLMANADKRAAHVILGSAVMSGRKEKPLTCSACGSGGRIHGHHEDYSKPLDVIWLCPKCHHSRHSNVPEKSDTDMETF